MPRLAVSIGKSWKLISANKTNLILAFIPLMLGLVLYIFAGLSFYSAAAEYGEGLIANYISSGTFGTIVAFILKAIITILIFFFVNWTFVMIVTVLAGPFNDILSSRIEKQIKNQELWSLSETFKQVGSNFIANIFNELKKITFILIVGLFAFVIGYIPLLTPVSIFLAVLLLAIGFLDYSWSRHKISFGSCIWDVRKNIFRYTFGGGIFFILVSVPVLNLIVPPLATSYFTLLWVSSHETGN